jgi:hypothetical protein
VIVQVTVLPDYEVLVRAARAAITSIPPAPATASEAELRRYDKLLRTLIGEAIADLATASAAERRHRDERARAAANRALDQWKPAIDELADISEAAAFLRFKDPGTITKKMQRTRHDGTPEWPEPDEMLGRSRGWTYRTIVREMAMAPGQGRPGIPRGPRQKKTAGR